MIGVIKEVPNCNSPYSQYLIEKQTIKKIIKYGTIKNNN